MQQAVWSSSVGRNHELCHLCELLILGNSLLWTLGDELNELLFPNTITLRSAQRKILVSINLTAKAPRYN